MQDIQKIISASLLRLRMKSPFFATLALFSRFVPTQQTPFAATDGKDVFFNADYLRSLPPAQQDGFLLHEVLHAALMHVLRRGVRDPKVWNIAADIVVNGVILAQGVFELPPGGIRDSTLEHLSVEEIYELLLKQDPSQQNLPNPDLLTQPPDDTASTTPEGDHPSSSPENQPKENSPTQENPSSPQPQESDAAFLGRSLSAPKQYSQNGADSLSKNRKAFLEAHWKNALQQAMVIARTTSQGHLPVGMDRELGLLTSPQLDWRAYLWRYLVQTPTDFMGFDRRFVGRGLYLESLVAESVKVFVAVDTSGSIDNEQLQLFLNEVQGILGSYPHLQCELYYVDAEAYGPHELIPDTPLPRPQGGGGTSFIPFFDKVEERWDRQTQSVCIYLTDGYGNFPELVPELPVVWVVTPGGLDLSQFPFGEAVRLLSI